MDKLTKISLSKYLYILFKYKEATSLIEEKSVLKDYKYVRHINFSSPKHILASSVTNSIYNISNTLQLSYKNMLSLPIMDNKIIYPDDIIVYINDKTISELTYKSDNKNISASIYRKFGSHIGSIRESKCVTSSAITGVSFDGLVGSFISNVIYFKIISVASSGIGYETSIDGQI